MLAAAPQQDQKQMLGERMFPLVQVRFQQILLSLVLLKKQYVSSCSGKIFISFLNTMFPLVQVRLQQILLSLFFLKKQHVSSRSDEIFPFHFHFLKRIYPNELPLLQAIYPDLAGKVTGMLLDIDNAEILHMLVDHNTLRAKVCLFV